MPGTFIVHGHLEIKTLLKKVYGDLISVHEVTSKLLSRDSNYIVDMVKWPKSGISSISMREVNITLIL